VRVEESIPFLFVDGVSLLVELEVSHVNVEKLEFAQLGVFILEQVLCCVDALTSITLALFSNGHGPSGKIQASTVKLFLDGLNLRVLHDSTQLGRQFGIISSSLSGATSEGCDLTELLQDSPARIFQKLCDRVLLFLLLWFSIGTLECLLDLVGGGLGRLGLVCTEASAISIRGLDQEDIWFGRALDVEVSLQPF
jgi:hypothetical protein